MTSLFLCSFCISTFWSAQRTSCQHRKNSRKLFSKNKTNKQANKNIKIPSWDGASIKFWSVQGVQLNSLPLYVQSFHSLLCIRNIAGGGSGELSILALWLKSIQRVFRGWQLISQTLNLNANIYHTAPAENRQWNLALLPWALQDFSRCSALI